MAKLFQIVKAATGAGEVTAQVLSNGTYAIAWTDFSPEDVFPFSEVHVQVFGQSGNKIGQEWRLNTSDRSTENQPILTALNDGTFIVAWSAYDESGAHHRVNGQRFSPAGSKLGAQFQITADDPTMIVTASIADVPNGFAVAWRGTSNGIYGIHTQNFDGAGQKLGPQVELGFYTPVDTDPKIVSLPNGTFVVGWGNANLGPADLAYDFLILNSKGEPTGNFFEVSGTPIKGGQIGNLIQSQFAIEGSLQFDIASLPNGNFVVVWRDGSLGIRSQLFTSEGVKIGADKLIAAGNENALGVLSVAATDDDRFAVGWRDWNENLLVQGFDETGNKQGEIQLIGKGLRLSLTTAQNGNVFATWDTFVVTDGQLIGLGPNKVPLHDVAAANASTVFELVDSQTLSGAINANDLGGAIVDKDWFKVTLETGKTYTFSASATVSASDSLDSVFIRLRDGSGNPLTVDKFAEGAIAKFDFTANLSGTYYLAISAGGANYADKTGSYNVGFTEKPTAPANTGGVDVVANDITTTAELANAVATRGMINQNDTDGSTTDKDYYKVTLTAGHTYVFAAEATVSGADTLDTMAIQLRDKNGNPVIPTQLADGATPSLEFKATTSGDYYLAVSASGTGLADKTGAFTVTATDLGAKPIAPTTRLVPDSNLLEYIAREIAYRFGHENLQNAAGNPDMVIHDLVKDTLGNVTGYAISNVFITANGFVAATLEGTGLEPVLAIRGSNSGIDWFSNANPKGVGFDQFDSAWTSTGLKSWLAAHQTEKINIVGHSQGGAQAQLVAAYATGMGIRIESVSDYNTPGISKDALTHLDDSLLGQVVHRISSGDIVSLAGETYVPGKVLIYDLDTVNPADPRTYLTHVLNAHVNQWSNSAMYNLPKYDGVVTRYDSPEDLGEISSANLSSPMYSPLWSNNKIDKEYFTFLLTVSAVAVAAAELTGMGIIAIEAVKALVIRERAEAFRSNFGRLVEALDAAQTLTLDTLNAIETAAKSAFLVTVAGIHSLQNWRAETWMGVSHWTAETWEASKNLSVEKWNVLAKWSTSEWNEVKDWTTARWASFITFDVKLIQTVTSLGATALRIVNGLAVDVAESVVEAALLTVKFFTPNAASLTHSVVSALHASGTAASEIINLGAGNDTVNPGGGFDRIKLGAGADTITGTAAQMDGSRVKDFTDQDRIILKGAFHKGQNLIITSNHGTVIDLDKNGDGISDSTFKLEGDIDIKKISVTTDGTNTTITTQGSQAGLNDVGTGVNNTMLGSPGNDRIDGRAGNDHLFGGKGKDALEGGRGDDALKGEAGDDTLSGGAGKDTLDGGAGTDTASYSKVKAAAAALDHSFQASGSAAGDNFVSIENLAGSEKGNDKLAGNGSANRLDGNGGDDLLFGRAGDDVLNGGRGMDALSGEAGKDTLLGGLGVDRLDGGAGADKYIYNSVTEGGDHIVTFTGADHFVFKGVNFGGMAAGALSASLFVSRADNFAQDGNDHFIYRTTDDTLWYDVDGSGTAGAVKIAALENGFKLTAGDILIV